ncbi:TlpA family protein disulfide reductase [Aureivirga sp. CE67]|uniref:TlpA family protein disulfide reductase n=1 Tax=Aureivirga sp. CE67 TaxID=1788983 RepID=UPI0018CB1C68|nr:TlpA disulfide reductase family protein [Aureivirga sp. CE67]
MIKNKKKLISNILFIGLIVLLIIPSTKAKILQFISMSPSVENVEDRKTLSNHGWNLKGVTSDNLNFKDTEDKVVLVNFWATWCPPCVAEMPSLQKLYNDYKDKVVFVFVSNEEPQKIKGFLKKNEYDLPIYSGLSKTPKELESSSIPATFLISKNGKIVIDKKGAADWNTSKVRKTIDELLAQ